ncbi:4-(cytidine 5'-diphospho)-2-C-methyl-D-erythritol kinase [Ornithinibacillus halotolerans]|uniref:4-diphosphocytidyl-2-C-methyl-D-erythritol kinase n=1 Tax=Ornithinibacillus halotolerans TaxID=1274357 RepID=A0A916W6P9_9BACI|nr:4-(cytidine 5'-diphospho)-2-C-methyl-D-erythritol kinase [Ornithinibacillus halotolerans]GGA70866.1 4-diphosphocytidyl-2-C-methyl-D-erythritol kinase [Ornithinibacillus halotolerans]
MTHFEKAPAKINLSLDVLSKRDDGYHNVEMIMTTVDLADRIELNTIEEDRVEVSLWSRYVPNDERNLAYKAAMAFKKKYNITKGVHIKIEKVIPVSAGLGGGSTDAAAVLRGLNQLWNMNIPIEELAALGSSLGSDIPFCVYGSTGIAKGFGEVIEKLPPPPPFWVVLAKPDIGVSTKTIFGQVNMDEITHPNTQAVIDALFEQDFSKLCANIGNSLERITTSIHPEVLRIKEKMRQAGAPGVLMSGSGPTVYGIVEQHSKAKRIYNSLKGFCPEVYLVRLIG